MNGVLVIDKPAGLTSHDVVARLRRILKTKKIGHTGTLDPFATGVLVMLVGKATRLAQFLDKDEKEYEAVVRFGYETDTGDITGSPKSEVLSPKSKVGEFLTEKVESVLPEFRGEIEQVPPMYSAKKIAGKKLYELARKGIEIERKAVAITLYDLQIFEIGPKSKVQSPRSNEEGDFGPWTLDIGLRATCSAGTYIRTLAEDIARAAGSAAHLAELRRTRAGRFSIAQAITLEELDGYENPAEKLVPMNEAVMHLPEMKLGVDEAEKIRHGIGIPARIHESDVPILRLTGAGDELVAIASYWEKEGLVRPRLVF